MLDALTPWHLLVVLVAFVLLVGYKKLPDASRSLGRSLRIFRSEVAAMRDEPTAAPALSGATADELEAQARAEEARAAALRARLAGDSPA